MIVIYFDGQIKRIRINKKNWNDLPHGILKVYDGKTEYFGWASYILIDNKVCGIHQIGTDKPLEQILEGTPKNLKFGVTIPDDEWKKLNMEGA